MAERLSNLRNIKPELLVLPTVKKLEPVGDLNHPPRILMLYGSLRERSFSRFLPMRPRASSNTSAPR